MSTPNPTHIITEHSLQKWHAYTGPHIPRLHATCWCGHTVEVESPQSNVNEARRILGPHVVSKLTDAGYSIVKVPDDKAPSPALIQAAYIAQDDLSKPPPQWAISAAAEIIDEYIRAQGNATVRVLGHPDGEKP